MLDGTEPSSVLRGDSIGRTGLEMGEEGEEEPAKPLTMPARWARSSASSLLRCAKRSEVRLREAISFSMFRRCARIAWSTLLWIAAKVGLWLSSSFGLDADDVRCGEGRGETGGDLLLEGTGIVDSTEEDSFLPVRMRMLNAEE